MRTVRVQLILGLASGGGEASSGVQIGSGSVLGHGGAGSPWGQGMSQGKTEEKEKTRKESSSLWASANRKARDSEREHVIERQARWGGCARIAVASAHPFVSDLQSSASA